MYAVGHAYLDSFSIGIQRQDGTVATPRSDSFTPHGVLWTHADRVNTELVSFLTPSITGVSSR